MKTKKVKGNFVLKKDTYIDGNLVVEGDIVCEGGRWNLGVEGDINAWDINAWDINAENINAWNINAGDINACNIYAGDINACIIDAGDINAWDINAENINAWNINAGDINARNITYYAVCWAYNNIKCLSIKGRRENSKHFVLDGRIMIKEKDKKEGEK